jgi:type II secretory pathway pseudopilin PulG
MAAKRIKQQGAILIIMLVILIIGFAAILVNSLSLSRVKNTRNENTTAVLAQAKDALIGFAVTYGDTHSNSVHGFLPCPDTDGNNGLQMEGSEETGGGSTCAPSNPGNIDVSVIGRLPWKTLGLATLRDGDGECLWYVVSGTYKDNPKTGMMNWDTNGQLQAYGPDGTLLANQVVAVIIAPGAAQSGQNRSDPSTPPVAPVCGGNYTVVNYLDNDTVHSINNTDIATGKFIQGTGSGNINDRFVYITRADIWNAVQKRTDFDPTNPNNPLKLLTRQVARCISGYGHYNLGWPTGSGWSAGSSSKALPWPAPLKLGTNQLSDYAVNANYTDSVSPIYTGNPLYAGPPLYAGRVPYNVATSKSASNNSLGSDLMTSTGSCRLIGPSGANAEPWTSNTLDPWWNNWKDHLFYALSNDYRPRVSTNQDCSGYPCLQINSSFTQYAAVVLLAGPRLSGQARTDKSVVTDYLESANGTNFAATSPPANGGENYITGASSPTFNDTMCYINMSLGVTCP